MYVLFKQVKLRLPCTHHKLLGTQILHQRVVRPEMKFKLRVGLATLSSCILHSSKSYCLSLQT